MKRSISIAASIMDFTPNFGELLTGFYFRQRQYFRGAARFTGHFGFMPTARRICRIDDAILGASRRLIFGIIDM